MAQNRKNDDFDLSPFEDLLGGSRSESSDGIEGFDIFNFSSADLDAAGIGRVQDDLDLNSFLNFDDLTEPEAEPKPELEPEPELEEDETRQNERSQRRVRKETAFAELFGEKLREEEPHEEDKADGPTGKESPEFTEGEEYEPPKKRGLFGRGRRAHPEPEYDDEPDEEESETEPYEPEKPEGEEELAPRRGLFARFLRPYEPEETEDAEPTETEQKPSLFRGKRVRGGQLTEGDDEQTPADGGISFFARPTPEKEKFQAIMQAKKEELARRRTELTAADNDSLAAEIGRELRRNESLVYDSELDEIDYIDRDDLPESRDYLPIRFRRYGRSGIGGGLMYAAFVISLSILLACFGWLCAADVLALSKDEVSAVVVVEPYVPKETDTLNADGDAVDERDDVITCDIDQVATVLKDSDIINFKFLFKLFAKLSHASAKIDPGTYDVSTKLDYRALITEMQVGSDSQEVTKITFPEGYRMEQMFQLLDDNGICDYDDLIDAAAYHDYDFSWLDEDWYYEAEGDPTRLEGYLFPDTYEFYQGESAVNVINRFLLRFHGLITQDMYHQAENLGITLHDAVIVASLVEKEAGANDDRANFSSVIYNRLNAGWKLRLDSTVNYVNNTSTFSFYYDDLETDSPYNTYVYEGLPKGPICSPGLASLNAALQPNSTDYWFWFAYDGSTYFFTNETDFNAFAEQYRDY